MTGLFRELSDWLLAFADSDWAALALGIAAFSESIFFPVPPDPLLLAISIPQPHMAMWLALLVTAASVAGAVVGHFIGRKFGRPLLDRMFSRSKVERVERMFQKYGVWAVLIAAVTPIPYKVFAIAAGVLDMDRRTFILASLVGRGARFLLLGALVMAFGEEIEAFIDANFDVLTLAGGAALVAGAVAFVLVYRWRRTLTSADDS